MQRNVNTPLYDTGWRVGMPCHINHNATDMQEKSVHVTAMDGRNYIVVLRGYGRPEWHTVDR